MVYVLEFQSVGAEICYGLDSISLWFWALGDLRQPWLSAVEATLNFTLHRPTLLYSAECSHIEKQVAMEF